MAVDRMANRAAAESDATIAAFVAAHYDRLLGLARLICRDANDAADAVQIGLEQAWRRRSTLLDDTRLRPWLDRIVVREAIRISNSRRSLVSRLFASKPDVRWIETADPHGADPSTAVSLAAAFDGLSPEQRAVVSLHMHLGYSVAETARIVGAPEETVRSRLRSAKDRLRHELRESRP